MEQGAQIERGRRAEALPGRSCSSARSLRRRRSGWLRCCWASCLSHRTRGGLLAGRIVEAEAYLGPHNDPPDPAAHSHRGPTPRNGVLFGPAGHAYVYSIYGRYFCMNITCEVEGRAGCVLLRALEPVAGLKQMARRRGLGPGATPRELTSGPGRLCQALGLTRNTAQRHGFAQCRLAAAGAGRRVQGGGSPGDAPHRHPARRRPAAALLRGGECLRLRAEERWAESASFRRPAPSLKRSSPHPHRVNRSNSNPERKPCT